MKLRNTNKTPDELKLEVFVHGLCVFLIQEDACSNYMSFRDSNRGECTHPCRWKYYLMEEKRAGEYLLFEDEREPIFLIQKIFV